MDKNESNNFEKNLKVGDIRYYFPNVVETIQYFFFPLLLWKVIYKDELGIVEKHGIVFNNYKDSLLFFFVSVQGNLGDIVEEKKKSLNKHLLENNLAPILSFKEYNAMVDKNGEKVESSSDFFTSVSIGSKFVLYLFEIGTQYVVKKTIIDVFQNKLGRGIIFILFTTIVTQGLLKKKYTFLYLNDSLPAFQKLSQTISLETFKYITLKDKNFEKSVSKSFLFEFFPETEQEPSFQNQLLTKKDLSIFSENIQRNEQNTKNNLIDKEKCIPEYFPVKLNQPIKKKNDVTLQRFSTKSTPQFVEKNTTQFLDYFPNAFFIQRDTNFNNETNQFYKGIFIKYFPEIENPLVFEKNTFHPGTEQHPNSQWFQLYTRQFMRFLPRANYEKFLPVSNFGQTKKLENWLQNFYSNLDEFPLKIEAPFNKKEIDKKTNDPFEREWNPEIYTKQKIGYLLIDKTLQSKEKQNLIKDYFFSRKNDNDTKTKQHSETSSLGGNVKEIDFLTQLLVTRVLEIEKSQITPRQSSSLFFNEVNSIDTSNQQTHQFNKSFQKSSKKFSPFFLQSPPSRVFFISKKVFFSPTQFQTKTPPLLVGNEIVGEVKNDKKLKKNSIDLFPPDQFLLNESEVFDYYPNKTTFFSLIRENHKLNGSMKELNSSIIGVPKTFFPLSHSIVKQNKVTIPNRFGYSKNWDLKVRVQDPFPQWFPKWLHWIKYLGLYRKREPISLDDLIPEIVYEKYAHPFKKKVSEEVKKPSQLKSNQTVSSSPTPSLVSNIERKKTYVQNFLSLKNQQNRYLYTIPDIRETYVETILTTGEELFIKPTLVSFEKILKDNFNHYSQSFNKTFEKNFDSLTPQDKAFYSIPSNKNILLLRDFFTSPFWKDVHFSLENKFFLKFIQNWTVSQLNNSFVSSFQKKKTYNQRCDQRTLVLKKKLSSPRLMSGYVYPDMEFQQLKTFYLNFLYKNLHTFLLNFQWKSNIDQVWRKEKDFVNFKKPPSLLLSIHSFKKNFLFFPHLESMENQSKIKKHSLFNTSVGIAEYQQLHNQKTSFQEKNFIENHVKIDLPPGFLQLGYWFLPNVENPISDIALKKSFLSKFKLVENKEPSPSLDLNNETEVFYKKEEILPFVGLQQKAAAIKEKNKKLSEEFPEEKKEELTEKEKKLLEHVNQVYTNFGALPKNSQQHLIFQENYQMKKRMEQNLTKDNPFNDVKGLVVDVNLQKKISLHNLKKPTIKKLFKAFSRNGSNEKKSTHNSYELNLGHTVNDSNQEKEKVNKWIVPKNWNVLPWFPTLDCERKEIVVFLPEEFWTTFLTKKKYFLDLHLTEIKKKLEEELSKKEEEDLLKKETDSIKIETQEVDDEKINDDTVDIEEIDENEVLNTTKTGKKLENIDLRGFQLKNLDINSMSSWFSPKTFYFRPTGKFFQKTFPFLDYKSPLSGFTEKNFSVPLQKEFYVNKITKPVLPIKKGFYVDKNVLVTNKKDQSKKNSIPLSSGDGLKKQTIHFGPYSDNYGQKNTMDLNLVGGTFNRREKFRYRTERPSGFKFLSPTILDTFEGFSKKLGSKKKIFPTFPFIHTKSLERLEKWEPVSSNTWLIIYKFGYVWFACYFLFTLYQKFAQGSLTEFLRILISIGVIDEELVDRLGFTDIPINSRVYQNLPTRFSDIAAIDKLLPSLGEIVWFLRNGGRGSKYLTKGVLLVGPPGTGKTFLVQAIGGEAQVPVLAQSGSTFYNLNDPDKVFLLMVKVFEKARKLAPCLLFMDEIDSLGSNRGFVSDTGAGDQGDVGRLGVEIDRSALYRNLFGGYSTLEENRIYKQNTVLLPEIDPTRYGVEREAELKDYMEMLDGGIVGDFIVYGLPPESNALRNRAIFTKNLNEGHDRVDFKKKKLNLLVTFLIQLDGIKPRQGVVIIGATNRADSLDPALVRPGRFDQIIHLPLPGKQKRIEILQFYSQKLGISQTVPWDYLANRTVGWSIADLAVAINQSSILAIMQETTHTLETIESGLEMVINSGEKFVVNFSVKQRDPFYVSRRGYYQGAKALVHFVLPNHPPTVVLHLWPQLTNTRENRRKNPLTSKDQTDFELTYDGFQNRKNLENRLVGCYAGKAGEILHLVQTSYNTNHKSNSEKIQNIVERNKRNNFRLTNKKVERHNRGFLSLKFVQCIGEKLSTKCLTTLPSQKQFLTKDEEYLYSTTSLSKIMPTIKISNTLFNFIHYHRSKLPHLIPLLISNNQFSKQQLIKLHHGKKNVFSLQKRKDSEKKKKKYPKKVFETIFQWYSDLGYEDLKGASSLAVAMIEKWHLYSDAFAIHKRHTLLPNYNFDEFRKNQDFILYMEEVTFEMKNELNVPVNKWHPFKRYQIWQPPGYYTDRAHYPLYLVKREMDWYRIYLPDRDERKWNVEWVSPDQYYHSSDPLKDLLSKNSYYRCNLNTWYALKRDYLYHGLLMSSFCKALLLVHIHRELLDFLAYHIMRFGILRQPEIETIIQMFSPDLSKKK